MANLSITAANVSGADGEWTRYELVAGATITAGQVCYMDTANSNVAKLAQSDGTELEGTIKGVAMHGASTGQPIIMATDGDIDIGATVTVGETYVLSQTAGGICPIGDLSSGDYVSHVGIGTAADNLKLSIVNSAVEVP